MPSITYKEIINLKYNLAPSQLQVLDCPNKNLIPVASFLSRKLESSDKGYEVGSINYISNSTHYFIRAKALQNEYFLPILDDETAKPIRPQSFKQYNLREGDLIISKDSNIGEVVILDKDYTYHTLSSALYRLPVEKHKYYLFAFMKHQFFKNQLDLLTPKGSTIRHSKTLFLKCKIPMPNQSNAIDVITYVELLTRAIINKEKEIRRKNDLILNIIEQELLENQEEAQFIYMQPQLSDLLNNNRIDAGFYCEDLERLRFLITNYKNGYSRLNKQGLEFIPGPSLEIRLLTTRIDSDEEKPGFYRLITPTQISIFGTISSYKYLGTSYEIPRLQKGDIIFGESGTGRTFVYLEEHQNTITNAHGHVLRPVNCSLHKTITIRCILSYLKEKGYIDYITVGGSGGHLSPAYFDRVIVPEFPEAKQKEIAALYYNNNIQYDSHKCTLDDFLEYDTAFNQSAGIYELDKSIKCLKAKLEAIINNIINNAYVTIAF